MNSIVDPAELNWPAILHWTLVTSMVALLGLHFRNRQRSGPIAALLFFIFGPTLAVILLLGWLFSVALRDPSSDAVYGIPVSYFVEGMFLIGILAALLGAFIHGFLIRDELRAHREFGGPGWIGRLRTGVGPAPALTALGLTPDAALEEVEQAYRERAKQAHPDRGGSVEEFKRLQIIYEQAKRQIARRCKTASKR